MATIPRSTPPARRLSGWRPVLLVLLAALALRAALTPLWAYLLPQSGLADEAFWKIWMLQIHHDGIINIFRGGYVNYVGYMWVLWLLSLVYGVIGGPYASTTPSLHILVKMPSIFFDLALIGIVYAATKAVARERNGLARPEVLAVVAAAVVALHPAIVYDSAVWAQTDAAITCAMLGAIVLAARGATNASWAVFALGFLVKPHPIIIVPVLAVLTLRHAGVPGLVRGGAIAVGVFLLVLSPWLVHGDARRIASVYKDLFQGGNGDLPVVRLSASAWNIWWLVDLAHTPHPHPTDTAWSALSFISYREVGYALSAAAGALASAYVLLRPRLHDALIAAAFLAFAFYMLPISTHERYLFPFVALLLPVALADRRWLWLYVPASAVFFLNLFIVAPPVMSWSRRWYEARFTLAMAGVNIALFLAFCVVLARAVGSRLLELRANPAEWRRLASQLVRAT